NALWDLLHAGRDAITEVPADRWDAAALYDPRHEAPGKMTTRWGGFLADVDRFDPQFFGISPREAKAMDPQQRLLLEVAGEALEDGGETRERIAGTAAGVFVGACNSDYNRLTFADTGRLDAYSATGTSLNVLTGRLSYWLDARGPSVAVDTACSASLVAVHL